MKTTSGKKKEDQNSKSSELKKQRYPNSKITLAKIELKMNRMYVKKISLII